MYYVHYITMVIEHLWNCETEAILRSGVNITWKKMKIAGGSLIAFASGRHCTALEVCSNHPSGGSTCRSARPDSLKTDKLIFILHIFGISDVRKRYTKYQRYKSISSSYALYKSFSVQDTMLPINLSIIVHLKPKLFLLVNLSLTNYTLSTNISCKLKIRH